jgi:hypothetical protein
LSVNCGAVWRGRISSDSVLLKLYLDQLFDNRDIEPCTLGHPASDADAENEFDWGIVAEGNQTLMDLVNLIIELDGTSSWPFDLSPGIPFILRIILPDALKLGKIAEPEYYIHMVGERVVGPNRTHNISGVWKQTGFHKIRYFFYWEAENALCCKLRRLVSR